MACYVDSMIINITDICSMECEFCLRGDGGNRKFDLSLIPRIFEGITTIDYLTISGGEPSCYVKCVKDIVKYLADHKDNININSLYIVTNGKEYRQELVDAVKTMLFIYLEKEYGKKMISGKENTMYASDSNIEELSYAFGIAVSLDEYHEPISLINYMKYRFSGIYSKTKEIDYSNGGVISRGRGELIYNAFDKPYNEFHVEHINADDVLADTVYVTVEGKIFGDCDMSYNMEQNKEPAGDLHEKTLADIIMGYEGED